MDISGCCMLCGKRKDKVKWLKPVYSWTKRGELEGYYCENHYEQVVAFNRQRKADYDASPWKDLS